MADKEFTIKCPKCKAALTVPGARERDMTVQCSECGHRGKIPRKLPRSAKQPVVLQAAKSAPQKIEAPQASHPQPATSGKSRSLFIMTFLLLVVAGIGFGAFTYFSNPDDPALTSNVGGDATVVAESAQSTGTDAGTETVDFTTETRVERPFIDTIEQFRRISDDLENSVSKFDKLSTRYFVLTHLHNAGVSDEELATTRQAFIKLLNSLSWHRDLYEPVAIDAEQTIYRVNLDKLKWRTKTWQAILNHDPYAFAYNNVHAAKCAEMTRESVIVVRADWFVFAASQPPLYYEILEVPQTLDEMAKELRVDISRNISEGEAIRAGFRKSDVSEYNRLIERHETLSGGFWVAYGFSGNDDHQDLFRYPLGPGTDPSQFAHDGTAVIFGLPNGLQGYMLTDGHGQRVDESSMSIIRDPQRPNGDVVAGISCISCHQSGIFPKTDEVGIAVRSNRDAFSHAERIIELYREASELESFQRRDAKRYQDSLAKLNVPQTTAEDDPVLLMVRNFEDKLDVDLAAAELGLTSEDLVLQISSEASIRTAFSCFSRSGGAMDRDDFLKLYCGTAESLGYGSSVRTVVLTKTKESPVVATTQRTSSAPETVHTDPKVAVKQSVATAKYIEDLFTAENVTFVSFDGKTVHYREKSGAAKTVDIGKLSQADLEIVLKQNVTSADLPADSPDSDRPALSSELDIFAAGKSVFVSFDGQQVSYTDQAGAAKKVDIGTLSQADQEFVLKQNVGSGDLPGDAPPGGASPPLKRQSLITTGSAELLNFDGRQKVTIKHRSGQTETVLIDSLSNEDIEIVLGQNSSLAGSSAASATKPGNDLPGTDLPGRNLSDSKSIGADRTVRPQSNERVWHGTDGNVLIEGALQAFDARKGIVRIAPAPRTWYPTSQPSFVGVLYVASSRGDEVEVKVKPIEGGRTQVFRWDQIGEADQQYLSLIKKGLESGRIEAERPLTGIRYWSVPIDGLSKADQQRVFDSVGRP